MEKAEKFDPFNDHQARMIRNQMSSTFIEGLALADPGLLEIKATALLLKYDHDHALYHDYLQGKIRSYRQVYAVLVKNPGIGEDVFKLAALLWEGGLFFEVHELLEAHWGKATGGKRKALQGLIQAAGFYLLLAAGNEKGAAKLADKAVSNLTGNRDQLPKALRLKALISALKERAARAPLLF